MNPSNPTPGIHHVTAITANAQANLDFYAGVLGMRLVKITVNFDDPGSYHLYYGDEHGTSSSDHYRVCHSSRIHAVLA